MGPKPANKRPKSVVGHKVVLKNDTNKPAKKITSIIKQPARINRPGSGKGDKKKKVAKVAKSSANVTKIIKQDFQRPVAPKQKQRRPTQPILQQQQPQQQLPPPQPRGRGSAGQMYSSTNAGSFMAAGSMALQTAQAVASNRGHPKHQEVGELLNTMNKGWIDQGKFADVLQSILF